jgi:CheY-like chemotaxis protein
VTWNLLSNAIKFTPAGGAVRVSVVETPNAYEIVVSDTGIGISAEFLPHVFERFRQADGSTTREHGGLGLGLAIVKELTELHGGTVEARSEGLRRGAAFTVTLQRLTGVMNGAMTRLDQAAQVEALDPPVRLDGVRVLAIDDNPDGLGVVRLALTEVGATVAIASSGEEGLALSVQSMADVVLCDLAMPHMDGFEVLRRLQLHAAAHGHMPAVIAISAYATAEYRERSLSAGFRAYLTKPLMSGELTKAVRAAVDRA